jgi:hypothetical protein
MSKQTTNARGDVILTELPNDGGEHLEIIDSTRDSLIVQTVTVAGGGVRYLSMEILGNIVNLESRGKVEALRDLLTRRLEDNFHTFPKH